MSASRDKSQKIGFVFSNLYQMYKKGKEGEEAVAVHKGAPAHQPGLTTGLTAGMTTGAVIKTGEVGVEARGYSPTEFIAKRVPRPPVLPSSTAVHTLRENLRALNDLHSRLRFMLQELEDLVKE